MKSSMGEWVRFEATALEPRVCAWRASRTHERERQCPGDPLLSHGLDWRVHVGLLPGSICEGVSSQQHKAGPWMLQERRLQLSTSPSVIHILRCRGSLAVDM